MPHSQTVLLPSSLLNFSSHVPIDFELAKRILIHPPANLHDLAPLLRVPLLGPRLETRLKFLPRKSIVCNSDSAKISVVSTSSFLHSNSNESAM